MLLEIFPSLQQNKFIILLNKFFYSIFYLIFIATLTAVSCIFGIEMYIYYVYVFCGCIFPCLFCKDMTPILAPLAMAYSSVSLKTNNAMEGHSLFGDRWHHLFIILGLIFAFVLTRLIYELVTKKEVRKYKHYLLIGYLIFGVTLILGGLFSPYYSGRNALFGLVEFLALFGCYFLLMYLIKWKEMKKDYFFYMMLFYGLALVAEVIYSLAVTNAEIVRTGWGNRNNIAGQLCLCVAPVMYLSIKKRIAPLYVVAGAIIAIGTLLTNSRNGTLMTLILALTTFIICMIKGKGLKKKLAISITSVLSVGAFLGFFFIFRELSEKLFSRILFENDSLFSISDRLEIWKKGLDAYLENRSFGLGWYYLKSYRDPNFTFDFVPARYHNSWVQIIATMGSAGAIAYIFHRYQTMKMIFIKPTIEKVFLFLSLMGLLLTSIFDCHFFNLGPGLNYCIILAFIEGVNLKEGITPRKTRLLKIVSAK